MILTKEFFFDSAHMLSNYNGKCGNIHGHTYKLKVFIKGYPIESDVDQKGGMILDFSEIKKIIDNYLLNKFDHALITTKKESFYGKLNENIKYCYLNPPFDIKTTCEMISLQILSDLIEFNIPIEAIELWETKTSSCYTTKLDLEYFLNNKNNKKN